jgi:CubicO group peptidase (beta-lactamase class C family)
VSMRRRDVMALPALAALATPALAAAETAAPPASLDGMLRPYLAQFGLPALAAAVVRDGQTIAAGAVGVRRSGADIAVTLDDRFHIGSDTKAMTALLAGMLVESDKLRWDSTVGEAFPELGKAMAEGVAGIKLEQLLSHTSGISADNEAQWRLVFDSFGQTDKNLDELRYWVVGSLVKQELAAKPGVKFAYSNLGYTLAGAMLERASGKTWEELIVARVFDPLGLKTAGLGPQSSLGRVDAPLGHRPLPDGSLKPMLAGPNGDNPEVIGPAGTAHMSVLDFAAWAGWNAGEGRRGPALVQPDTLKKLHRVVIDMPPRPDAPVGTPSSGSYGLGWGQLSLPFSSEPFLFHGGSNELNLAYILLQPKSDFGMVLITNVGGERADRALKAAGAELYKRFGPNPAP